MINLEWLRTFGAIYECRNITEASKKLNMTQPGVSKHLSALENHIGKKLFERTTRKLSPTEYGKFLYSQINNPLQELKKVEYYSYQRRKKPRHVITIGCTTDFFREELLHRIYDFDMYIVTRFGNERDLIEALDTDTIQLLVGIKKHTMYDHLFDFLKNEDLVLICSKNIDIPSDPEQNQLIKWLEKQSWFVFDNDQNDIKQYWETNFNTVPKIVPRYILPSYIDIIEALKISTGVSIVPWHLCKKAIEKDQVIIPFKQLKRIAQKRYYSYKLKNSNLKEIQVFKEHMQI